MKFNTFFHSHTAQRKKQYREQGLQLFIMHMNLVTFIWKLYIIIIPYTNSQLT